MSKTPLEESFGLPSLSTIEEEADYKDEDTDFESEYTDEDTDFESDFPDEDEPPELSQEEITNMISGYRDQVNQLKQYKHESTDKANKHLEDYLENMNEVHRKAMVNFDELINSIMSMEAAHGAKFLMGATKLLDIAKDSQNTSMDRVIKMSKLQMEHEKHTTEMKDMVKKPKTIPEGGDVIETNDNNESEVVTTGDRNNLMAQLRTKKDSQ